MLSIKALFRYLQYLVHKESIIFVYDLGYFTPGNDYIYDCERGIALSKELV